MCLLVQRITAALAQQIAQYAVLLVPRRRVVRSTNRAQKLIPNSGQKLPTKTIPPIPLTAPILDTTKGTYAGFFCIGNKTLIMKISRPDSNGACHQRRFLTCPKDVIFQEATGLLSASRSFISSIDIIGMGDKYR